MKAMRKKHFQAKDLYMIGLEFYQNTKHFQNEPGTGACLSLKDASRRACRHGCYTQVADPEHNPLNRKHSKKHVQNPQTRSLKPYPPSSAYQLRFLDHSARSAAARFAASHSAPSLSGSSSQVTSMPSGMSSSR
jgi:hypothetical protein